MIIRKLFNFENAHIVRGCSTKKCRSSIHGHSYKLEVFLESNYLDNGQMIYDFGLLKSGIKDIVDSFDHSITLWRGDDSSYLEDMKKHSSRYVVLDYSPSAEQFSRIFFVLVDKLLELTKSINGERDVILSSIIVHETQTGYAQCFRDDAYNPNMGLIDIANIEFSSEILKSLNDPDILKKLSEDKVVFTNPKSV